MTVRLSAPLSLRLLLATALISFVAALAGCYVSIGTNGVSAGIVKITGQPQSVTVKAGATATFDVSVIATGALTFQWRRDGAAIAGATSFAYTTPAVTLADNGAAFDVVVCNDFECVTSSDAILSVQP